MEKYGVNQNTQTKNKQASSDRRCPVCGSSLTVHGTVLLCRLHGSAPFENTDSNTDED